MKSNSPACLIKLLIIAVLIVLLWPVKVPCRVPGYTCTTAPNQNQEITRVYDIEPLGVKLIETVIRTDLFIKYKQGYDQIKI